MDRQKTCFLVAKASHKKLFNNNFHGAEQHLLDWIMSLGCGGGKGLTIRLVTEQIIHW